MNDLSEVVVSLENKVKELLHRYEKVNAKNEELNQLVDALQVKLKENNAELAHLREKYQRTKVASALSGTGEGVRETKLRINRLVREIDSCITLMQG